MRVLSNADVERLLPMADCVAALEGLYREMASGEALSRQRSDLVLPHARGDGTMYCLKSMDGASQAAGVGAVRINSDVVSWPTVSGSMRRVKVPAAPGQRWVGLVLLFSTATGEPLAILPDGQIQRMRVGGTGALAIKYLAREDARVVAILGSGWQAGAALMGAAAVRELEEARVYSPDPHNRTRFAAEWSERLGMGVAAVDSAARAVAGADVVLAATNALDPVFDADLAEPGMHLGCVRQHELGEALLERASVVAVNAHEGVPLHVLHREAADHPELRAGMGWAGAAADAITGRPLLAEIVAGRRPGRTRPEEITVFLNNIGLGAQFAAVGARLLEAAAGAGHDLPTEWFTQDVHP